MHVSPALRNGIFFVLVAACLTPWVSPPIALFLGLVLAQTTGNPFAKHNKKLTTWLLQISVVGLGFGMNLEGALRAGQQGIGFTIATIVGTLVLGALMGRLLKVDRKTSHLISSGTAICGGSAIAAVAPVIHAEDEQISVALGTVFVLNALALFIFPAVGHALNLSQMQFGLWSAIAIHDTSSVVGAASSYGAEALGIATTVKLTRALWIIPLAIGTSFFFRNSKTPIKIPYFMAWYIVAMCINTYVPAIHVITPAIVAIAKAGLTLTLFLIGSGLSRESLRMVGVRPLVQGVVLWIVISVVALWAVVSFGVS